jgi:hypothetical protein
LTGRWGVGWAVAAIVAGIGLLISLEILEEPDLTLVEILLTSRSSRSSSR